jgi:hypothetical protein
MGNGMNVRGGNMGGGGYISKKGGSGKKCKHIASSGHQRTKTWLNF